ncbi:hypothetical protein [Aquimarina litoralis]|uniref:hypothetical protein n=1 Tax=Aquimarina litoralis TaxID=584605 RepID=UPI001C58D8B2|nr:hypothetical protein [Aquimarina litoralis]MBW1295229.1 hypothetical protein [Aquimarina litoralis]
MEPMDIFYQILHEDLNPLTSQTNQKSVQEYSKNLYKNNEKENLKTDKGTFDFYEDLLPLPLVCN